MYPVTAVLSVAVKVVTGTVRLVAVAGMVNTVTVGAIVSLEPGAGVGVGVSLLPPPPQAKSRDMIDKMAKNAK
jgi:hypothetical protein